ncbi:hypothetical protein [Treponema sp.]|uniref:hypothetical protein n=1 Tax=Treponema sp. TaxID=166 RepID=UPI003F0C3F67
MIKKLNLIFILFLLSCGICAAQESLMSEFYKGNLIEKKEVVEASAASGDSSIAIAALDFSISAYDALIYDDDFITLAETAVKSLTAGNCRGKEKLVSEKLKSVFKLFNDSRVIIAVIDAFSVFQSQENLYLVNDFFYSNMQNQNEMNEAILKAVLFMETYGNSASFNMLFIADILDIWPSYSEILSSSYGSLANESEKEILQFLATVPVEKKILILKKLDTNPKISKKICGEAAENALSSVIYNIEGAKLDFSGSKLDLALVCLEVISDTQWTRSASLVAQCFDGIKKEYESGRLSDTEFSAAIKNIAAVSSSETVLQLSSYLDFLNKQAEKNKAPSKAVVLSLINSLGDMGDKTAFDSLLYATYIDYPEEVVAAAKNALAKLKW